MRRTSTPRSCASTISIEEIRARQPKGIIFSGGPKSVYATPAPTIDPAVYELGIPILGLCYGAQLIAMQLGGQVAHTGNGEYGRTKLTLDGPVAALHRLAHHRPRSG